ncbi:hypothetical protein BD770DRAFT_165311 [Pilaira anomala]|nr:hypothetical protein BD770DRAFT_165311 [Pilaira anomala]
MKLKKMKDASFETFKRRRFFIYLYANDKLTMLSTSVVSNTKWGLHVSKRGVNPKNVKCPP